MVEFSSIENGIERLHLAELPTSSQNDEIELIEGLPAEIGEETSPVVEITD